MLQSIKMNHSSQIFDSIILVQYLGQDFVGSTPRFVKLSACSSGNSCVVKQYQVSRGMGWSMNTFIIMLPYVDSVSVPLFLLPSHTLHSVRCLVDQHIQLPLWIGLDIQTYSQLEVWFLAQTSGIMECIQLLLGCLCCMPCTLSGHGLPI